MAIERRDKARNEMRDILLKNGNFHQVNFFQIKAKYIKKQIAEFKKKNEKVDEIEVEESP